MSGSEYPTREELEQLEEAMKLVGEDAEVRENVLQLAQIKPKDEFYNKWLERFRMKRTVESGVLPEPYEPYESYLTVGAASV